MSWRPKRMFHRARTLRKRPSAEVKSVGSEWSRGPRCCICGVDAPPHRETPPRHRPSKRPPAPVNLLSTIIQTPSFTIHALDIHPIQYSSTFLHEYHLPKYRGHSKR
ncbi:hypothetical protein K469DRAFT_137130 [Zopfia rhizophila CBS 207.26]|uniref:Uncharacterized protein n=1 Tax=Zopfia rhizophila CBS 207.26 TaxID=1314779 RepID=A0A6A6ERV4_9PEZI|nr:hypothetical protein K469DRAFT_137130 [Zopfia rhizophila CBS 207.26]